MRETALQIYLALLARDPLPHQRFQSLGERFSLLAELAQLAARQFEDVNEFWQLNPEEAIEQAASRWDLRAANPLPDHRQVKNKIGVDLETHLPASQGDLLSEVTQHERN